MSAHRARISVVASAASVLAVFAVIKLVISSIAPAEASAVATVDGLTAQVTRTSWAVTDHDRFAPTDEDGPGSQVMTGMPADGEVRLRLDVCVINTGDQPRPFLPSQEFALYSANDGRRYDPHAHTFGDLPRFAPGAAAIGQLLIDVPAELAGTPVWLEWEHDSTTTWLTIPTDRVATAPGHGSDLPQ